MAEVIFAMRSITGVFEVFLAVFTLVCIAWISPSHASSRPTCQNSEEGVRSAIAPESGSFKQLAQNWHSNPNEDRFLRPIPLPSPVPSEPEKPVAETTPTPPPVSETNGEIIPVQEIKVTGYTVFKEEINKLKQPLDEELLKGDPVTKEELQKLADDITKLYLEAYFLTSSASLTEESLSTEVAEIRVTEGTLEKIEIEGTQRLNPDYVRSRAALGAGTPLNVSKLEDQLRLLRANPLFKNLEATLKPGSQDNTSILVVIVTEADPFGGSVGFDNYSPPSIGADRFILDLEYRNLTGIGDAIFASYRPRLETIAGTYRLELTYQAPLNLMDGSLQLRALLEANQVIQEPFKQLDISGNSQWYTLSFRQPVIRTPREELALSVGFTYQQGQTFTFQGPTPFGLGPNEQGISRTSVVNFGQDYTLRDISGAWALRSQFNFGTSLLDATENPSPIPDGLFFSWLAQVQRAQVINQDNLLIVQADLQLTPDSLLPSQQFVIGGAQSVRGYRQNVRAGDNGLRFSIEDRITLVRDEAEEPLFILAPFFDLGYVWNAGDNPNFQPSQRFIAGLGLGFIWQPIKGMNIRLDYAPPLVNLGDQGNNVQDHGFYFSVNYKF